MSSVTSKGEKNEHPTLNTARLNKNERVHLSETVEM